MKNKLTESLAGQAFKYAAEHADESGKGSLGVFADKFAELLVQECADICQQFGESGDGYTCSAEILEHFGVEE